MPHLRTPSARRHRTRTALLVGAALAILALVGTPAVAKCPRGCKKEIKTGLKNCERVCPKGKAGSTCRKTCKAFKRAAAALCVNASVVGEPRPASPTDIVCAAPSECGEVCGPTEPCVYNIPCTKGQCCSPEGGPCVGLSLMTSACCCQGLSCQVVATSGAGVCRAPTTTTIPGATTTTLGPVTTTTIIGATTTTLAAKTCANGGLGCGAQCGGACGGTCVGGATAGCSLTHCGSEQQVCAKLATPGGTCTTSDAYCNVNSVCVGNASAPCGTAFCWQVCPEGQ